MCGVVAYVFLNFLFNKFGVGGYVCCYVFDCCVVNRYPSPSPPPCIKTLLDITYVENRQVNVISRIFQEEWTYLHHCRLSCLIGRGSIAFMKQYSMGKHYPSKPSQYDSFQNQLGNNDTESQ